MVLFREEIRADSADVDDPMMNYNKFVDEVRKPGKRVEAMVIEAVTRKYTCFGDARRKTVRACIFGTADQDQTHMLTGSSRTHRT